MKRIILTAAALLLLSLCSIAQVTNVLDVVKADRNKIAGCESPYRFEEDRQGTPAPKGFKPFYISHYGRHGSRFAWNSKTYTLIHEALEKANEKGLLTERGKRFREDYLAFYEVPLANAGDLTELGWEQHTRIATNIYAAYKNVFRKGGIVNTMASVTPRAIVSMNAFDVAIQKCNPRLSVTGNSLHTNLAIVVPPRAPELVAHHYNEPRPLPGGEKLYDFAARMIDEDAVLGNIFSDTSFIGDKLARQRLLYQLFTLWAGYRNYCDNLFMEDIFTPEQQLALWEIENYACYTEHVIPCAEEKNLIDNIIDYAERAIAGNGVVMDARFGHDTVFNALCPELNVNGSGHLPESADDVKYWFQNYNTPKAATIVFVLYRSRKPADGILFKVVRNGIEVALPQLKAVSGPYYRWEDFKAWRKTI